jgi:hypothetical protein
MEFLYLIFLLIIFLIAAVITRWMFRIDTIAMILQGISESLKNNEKQNSVLIQQNDEIITLLAE